MAAFPAGNPAAGTTPAQEVERLLVKQAAGASFAITQLFWDPDVYASFVERARRAGVTLPIVPGILPATDPARLRRVQDLTGIEVPEHILAALSDRSDQEARYAFGAAFGSRLFHDVSTRELPASTSTPSTRPGPSSTSSPSWEWGPTPIGSRPRLPIPAPEQSTTPRHGAGQPRACRMSSTP